MTKLEWGTEAWWKANLEGQKRDADKLRMLVAMNRHVLLGLGLKLTGIEVDGEQGRAHARIYGMIEARDLHTVNAIQRPRDPTTIVEIEGLPIREKTTS